jgi:hypothetical protein
MKEEREMRRASPLFDIEALAERVAGGISRR